MNREVPYCEDEQCDLCGRSGAYDFTGDLICADCACEIIESDLDGDEGEE